MDFQSCGDREIKSSSGVMQDFLMTPEAQSSLLPLVFAFILGLILIRLGERCLGFAVIGGFLLTVLLTVGLEFQPLTSTRKIILCSLLLPLLALLIDWLGQRPLVRIAVLMSVLAVAAIWVVWPVLIRLEGMEVLLLGARVALYAAGIGGVILWLNRGLSYRESGALMALGIGTGACALVAASGLYAQLSFAVAAAIGGALLVLLLSKSSVKSLGSLSLFAAAVPLALLGGASSVFAKLPPAALGFLFLIPVFAAIPLNKHGNLWLRTAVSGILGLFPAVPAIWITWKAAGPVIY